MKILLVRIISKYCFCNKSLLYILFILLTSTSKGQELINVFDTKGVNHNISQRAITCFSKDADGFMWIGTHGNGLYQYDGVNYKQYLKKWESVNSLAHNTINTIFVDKSNKLWIGSENGIQLFNKNDNSFKSVTLNGGALNVNVHSISQSHSGKLLVGTHKYGLLIVDTTTLNAENVNYSNNLSLLGLEINAIKQFNSNTYWLATNKGLMCYNSLTNTVISNYTVLNEHPAIEISLNTVYKDVLGNMWLGSTNSGLIKYDLSNNQFYFFNTTTKRILDITNLDDSTLIIATENDGLFIISNKGEVVKNIRQHSFENSIISSNSIWSLKIDEQQRIWVGYYDKGFDVFDSSHNKFYSLTDQIRDLKYQNIGSVSGICRASDNEIWIATNDNGLFKYHIVNKSITPISQSTYTEYKGLDSKDITSIYSDSKHNLWVGTWTNGLYLLKHNSKIFKNYNSSSVNNRLSSNRIMTFTGDNKGNVWIGSFLGGLMKYDINSDEIVHISNNRIRQLNLNNANIRKLLLDREKNLWIGTRNGLYQFKINPIDNSIFQIEEFNTKLKQATKSDFKIPVILSVFEDFDGDIWFGTEGMGLFNYKKKSKEINWFFTHNGLQQETINSINSSDKNSIWLAGNNGLTTFNKEKNNFKTYDTNDGLLVNTFNRNASFKSKDELLMFGNALGVNVFNPKNVKINSELPIVHVTGIEINSQNKDDENYTSEKSVHKFQNHIELNYNQSVFTINYVGINFTRGQQNKYAYFLEGFDKDWNYVNNKQSATYTNLAPGDYVFKVKASNNEGIWNETPETIKIVINKPWWGTHLMLITYILILLTISFIIYDLTKAKIRQRQAIKSERIKLNQTEALNAKKIQFFTNISHEFRTPLTLIINPLEAMLNSSYHFPEDIKNKLQIIKKNTDRLFRLINELMDFRKLQFNKLNIIVRPTNINDFIKNIITHFEEEAFMRKIQLKLFQERIDDVLWIDSSLFEKIIFNLLSNAFKATPDKGTISISVKKSENVHIPSYDKEKNTDACTICIKDNGIGVKKEDLDKIFNRFYQTEALNQQYYGGTGIGLEVVRSFVELHKGLIEVKSDGVSGTEFNLNIPFGKSHFNENEIDVTPLEDNTSIPIKKVSETNNKNIDTTKPILLVVEDNIELRKYLVEQLENEYQVLEAKDGVQGLKIAQKQLPELIISDIMMPLMNGFDFCEQLKANSTTSHIPVIMLTAKTLESDRIKGIGSGAEVYLKKPFSIALLKSHIRQLIKSRKLIFEKYYNGVITNDISNSKDKDFISSVLNYIHQNLGNPKLNVEFMAKEMLLSRSKLYRKIKMATGDSANEFIRKIRLEKAKEYLEQTDKTVSEICYLVGFSSPSYFSKCYKQQFGAIPKKDRKINQ